MARRERQKNGPVTDPELEAFREAMREQRGSILEALAEDTGRSPEEIEAAVAEYEMPETDDPEAILADEFYGDE